MAGNSSRVKRWASAEPNLLRAGARGVVRVARPVSMDAYSLCYAATLNWPLTRTMTNTTYFGHKTVSQDEKVHEVAKVFHSVASKSACKA